MKNKTIITKAETLINILNDNGFTGFVDSTSRNDLTESIYNEKLELQIFLPNGEIDDWENEQWDKFNIIRNSFDFDPSRKTCTYDNMIKQWKPVENFMMSIGCQFQ